MQKSLQINDRLKTIFYYLLTLQCLKTEHILNLNNFYGSSEPIFESKSRKQICKTFLIKLRENGLIESRNQPLTLKKGRPEQIHQLTRQGLSLAAQVCQIDISSRFKKIPDRFILHHCDIVDLVLGIRQISPRASFQIDGHYRKIKSKNVSVLEINLGDMGKLKPDIRFGLQKKFNIFVEVDRGTENISIISKKFDKYGHLQKNFPDYFNGLFKALIVTVPNEDRFLKLSNLQNKPKFCKICLKSDFFNTFHQNLS